MTPSCSSFTFFKLPDILSEEIEGELYPPTACANISAKLPKVQSCSEHVSVNNAEIAKLKASQSIVPLYMAIYHLDDDSTFDDFIVYSDCGWFINCQVSIPVGSSIL
jgi:hypothetical protein